MKKTLIPLLALLLVLPLCACSAEEDESLTAAELAAPNVAGVWKDDESSCTLTITQDGAELTVSGAWTESAEEAYAWTMTAEYDLEEEAFLYTDGEKTLTDSNGVITVYTNGYGSFTVGTNGLYWFDEEEKIRDGCLFRKSS